MYTVNFYFWKFVIQKYLYTIFFIIFLLSFYKFALNIWIWNNNKPLQSRDWIQKKSRDLSSEKLLNMMRQHPACLSIKVYLLFSFVNFLLSPLFVSIFTWTENMQVLKSSCQLLTAGCIQLCSKVRGSKSCPL